MTTKQSGIRLARRLDEVGFSDIVQIRNKVMGMRAEGLQVHALHGGEPYFETPTRSSTRPSRRWWRTRRTMRRLRAYCRCARRWWKSWRRRTASRRPTDEVIATVGGSQGLYAAFQSVLDPGDDALVFSPYWTPIGDLVTGAQARPLLVPTSTARRNGIRKTLEQFSTPQTRAIYYNTPQNPSGLVFTRDGGGGGCLLRHRARP